MASHRTLSRFRFPYLHTFFRSLSVPKTPLTSFRNFFKFPFGRKRGNIKRSTLVDKLDNVGIGIVEVDTFIIFYI